LGKAPTQEEQQHHLKKITSMHVESSSTKDSQPPTSVEGVDWVVLNPRASPIKKLLKQKFPSKLNVGEVFIGTQNVV
jgi:hypothetical protein